MSRIKKGSLESLVSLANALDAQGLQSEADTIDAFIKSASFLDDISAWIAGQMDEARLARIAGMLGAKKLAEVAKKMDPEMQKEIIQELAKDPEVAQMAVEALIPGVPEELVGQLGGAAAELMEMLGKKPVSSGEKALGPEGIPDFSDLQNIFPQFPPITDNQEPS